MSVLVQQAHMHHGEIQAEETPAQLAGRIVNEDIVICRGVFDAEALKAIKQRVHQFGLITSEQNLQTAVDVVTFHRIDHNHPKSGIQRSVHFYRFSYRQEDPLALLPVFRPLSMFRNVIAGLDKEYTFYQDDNGFLSQPSLLHYPRGGGYMARHVDPVIPQRVEMVLVLSTRGSDFQHGGLCVHVNGTDVDVEASLQVGDICMFRPDLPHGVLPIDPEATLDWASMTGRWTMFCPIAHAKDRSKNSKLAPSRYA